MGHMKQLYTELQEEGWEKEDIEKIPDKLAWKMAGLDKLQFKRSLRVHKQNLNIINNAIKLCKTKKSK